MKITPGILTPLQIGKTHFSSGVGNCTTSGSKGSAVLLVFLTDETSVRWEIFDQFLRCEMRKSASSLNPTGRKFAFPSFVEDVINSAGFAVLLLNRSNWDSTARRIFVELVCRVFFCNDAGFFVLLQTGSILLSRTTSEVAALSKTAAKRAILSVQKTAITYGLA